MKRIALFLTVAIALVACGSQENQAPTAADQSYNASSQQGEEDTVATTEVRPDGDVAVGSWWFKVGLPVPFPDFFEYVDDDPDDDSTYIWFVGTQYNDPTTIELSFGDAPSDLLETMQLTLRVRWSYDMLGHAYQVKGRYRLRSLVPDPDWTWETSLILLGVYPLAYTEYAIPVTLTKEEFNDLRWLWTVDDDYNCGIYGVDWRVTEVRLDVEYTPETPTGILGVNSEFNRKTFSMIRKFS